MNHLLSLKPRWTKIAVSIFGIKFMDQIHKAAKINEALIEIEERWLLSTSSVLVMIIWEHTEISA